MASTPRAGRYLLLGATVYELLTGKPPFYSGQIDRLVREKFRRQWRSGAPISLVTSKTAIPQHWGRDNRSLPGQGPGGATAEECVGIEGEIVGARGGASPR